MWSQGLKERKICTIKYYEAWKYIIWVEFLGRNSTDDFCLWVNTYFYMFYWVSLMYTILLHFCVSSKNITFTATFSMEKLHINFCLYNGPWDSFQSYTTDSVKCSVFDGQVRLSVMLLSIPNVRNACQVPLLVSTKCTTTLDGDSASPGHQFADHLLGFVV